MFLRPLELVCRRKVEKSGDVCERSPEMRGESLQGDSGRNLEDKKTDRNMDRKNHTHEVSD